VARRVATFKQATAADLAALGADPSLVSEMLDRDEGDEGPELLDIDKAWHGIHFLLTGGARGGEALAVDPIFGGRELGPARVLGPDEVKQAAEALAKVPTRKLWARYDAKLMTNAQIYPEFWEEKKDALDYLIFHFEKLVEYYRDAAKRGNGMLIVVT
jgi:hypothetical protein